PVIPANMESVIDEELAIKLAKNGYFYIMHRFGIDNLEFVKKMKEMGLVSSISIGVNPDSYDLIDSLIQNDAIPDYITIDIAHGHCKKMKKMLKYIKETNKGKMKDCFIIAGNVSSIEATVDLDKWGADAIKVGIGPGCFVGNVQVLTDKGYKKLEDIKEGDMVFTHTNNFQKVLSTTSYFEEDDLISINNIISTKKHQYYVTDISNKYIIDKNNYKDHCYWVEANQINPSRQFLIKLLKNYIELIPINSKNHFRNNKGITMYDITVENDHSYTVYGNVVHNSACTTYPTTGFGSRNIQASIINDCANVSKKPIIADGGIKYPADITKSIVLGSTMVMVGGMLSSFVDSPGRTVEQYGKMYKEFYGSASDKQSNKKSRIEGTVKLNPIKNSTLIEYLDYLSECLQSSISYGGGKNIDDLYSVKWI
ncbi:MAG: IMP dehydrogenase, partial [bacterium]